MRAASFAVVVLQHDGVLHLSEAANDSVVPLYSLLLRQLPLHLLHLLFRQPLGVGVPLTALTVYVLQLTSRGKRKMGGASTDEGRWGREGANSDKGRRWDLMECIDR